jgi:hypothetical protein
MVFHAKYADVFEHVRTASPTALNMCHVTRIPIAALSTCPASATFPLAAIMVTVKASVSQLLKVFSGTANDAQLTSLNHAKRLSFSA